MGDIIGHQPTKWENRLYIFAILVFCVGLFVLLSQPVWRGEEMAAEFTADCEKRGGVLLTHKKTFSTEYQCKERLD